MNVCELRLYNANGVVVDTINFLAYPFSAPFKLTIPQATRRNLDVGNNPFSDGASIADSKYNNATITFSPQIFMACTERDAATAIESLRGRIDSFITEARNYTLRQTLSYVRFAEDTKGFVLESEIIDGQFDINEDWSWSNVNQGVLSDTSIVLVRRPFRLNPQFQSVQNWITNPSFEVCDANNCYLAWVASAGSPALVISNTRDSIDGDKSISLKVAAGASSGGQSFSQISPLFVNQYHSPAIGYNQSQWNDTMFYVEAWCRVEGNPAKARWEMRIDDDANYAVAWTAGESPTYIDPRWYRNRATNTEDIGTMGELNNKKYFIRKGFLFAKKNYPVAPSIKFALAKLSFVHVNLEGGTTTEDSTLYIDRVYMTNVNNYMPTALKMSVFERMYNATGAGRYFINKVVTLTPSTNPSDIEYMPRAWGSGTIVNPVFDHNTGATSYVDIDGVGGDVPAVAELYIQSVNQWDANYTAPQVKSVMAGMTSKGSKYFTREFLTLTQSSAYWTSPVNGNDTVSDTPKTISVSNTDYNTSSVVDFHIFSRTGLQKISGAYNVIVRVSNSGGKGSYANLKARFAQAVGTSGQYLYGKEKKFPTTNGSLLYYTIMDLGTIVIPDTSINNHIRLQVQLRKATDSATQNVSVDCITLIPADEWYLSGELSDDNEGGWTGLANDRGFNPNNGGFRQWATGDLLTYVPLIRNFKLGAIEGRDNLLFKGFNISGGASGTYVSGSRPFIMPSRRNRVYINTTTWTPDDAVTPKYWYSLSSKRVPLEYWYTSAARGTYWVRIRYQERYL